MVEINVYFPTSLLKYNSFILIDKHIEAYCNLQGKDKSKMVRPKCFYILGCESAQHSGAERSVPGLNPEWPRGVSAGKAHTREPKKEPP